MDNHYKINTRNTLMSGNNLQKNIVGGGVAFFIIRCVIYKIFPFACTMENKPSG
jgi:hypothetical protein